MSKILTKVHNRLETLKRDTGLWYDAQRYKIRVMSALQTIRYIQSHKCSVARFGDGELNMILKGKSIGFQKNEPELAEKLKAVLCTNDPNLLICLPHCFSRFYGENLRAREFWKSFLENNRAEIAKILYDGSMKGYRFGDTQMTRPYMDYSKSADPAKVYSELKKIWDNRSVLIVEGYATRMGVGNDLFDNALSINRIICPAENAYGSYDRIKAAVTAHCSEELVLLALGPTATVLAADLSDEGLWAIDVGHLDVEYEWYKNGVKEKTAIKGKYVNEVSDGRAIEDCSDETYLGQIIARV